MAIACAYCGGEHDHPREIRTCWTEHGEKDVATADDLPVPDAPSAVAPDRSSSPDASYSEPSYSDNAAPMRSSAPSARRVAAPTFQRGVAAAGAGPDALGRRVAVDPEQEPPARWANARRVMVSSETLADTASLLELLRTPERLVLELHDVGSKPLSAGRVPKLMTTAAPFEVGASFTFAGDEIHHLLWSNTVDSRGGSASWDVLDQAVALGCTALGPDEPGDVALPDGTIVWLDGGPLRYIEAIDSIAVLHSVTIEHGQLAVPTTNESGAELALDQLAAVTHPGGAARIIAPAGSGKTRVLTERARHLLTNWRLPSTALSLVAFNKRAQEEMLERTPDLSGLHVRTLNAIALAIVNGSAPFAPQPKTWRTISEIDVRRMIGDLVSFPKRRNSDPVAPWIEALTLVRLGLVSPSDVEARYGGDIDGFAAFWPSYRAALERRNSVDFDDQVYRALMVLLSDPEARRAAQRACRSMLVDEFQDLTPAHLLLIRLLASPRGCVFGVGDDDQTIYGYNGADPGWLIDFGGLFPGAGAHPLEVNYRCPGGVVDIADRLLRHNTRRVDKVIRAHSTDANGWSVDTSADPVGASIDAVRSALASGAAPSEVAVLARVNAVLAPVQVALVGEGIPISGGVGAEFVERTSVRSALAWLRIAATDERGRFTPADLGEAIRRPSRSFHPRITGWITEQGTVADLFKLSGRLNNERDVDRLMEFAADITTMQKIVQSGAPTSEVIRTLIDEIGLAGSVAGLDATRHGMNRAAQGDDLTAIQHLAALHDDVLTFDSWLRSRLSTQRSGDGVILSTVHRVKGQEWPHVVVHHVDAEQYPHRLAEDVEEERRLFHVAITRASRHATIVAGPSPSPFVEELTTEPSPERVISSHRPPGAPARTAGKPAGKQAGKPAGDPVADLDAAAAARFDRLKALRYELAAGKPAYVVFDNKTLAAIARVAPTSKQQLAKISGVGPAKLDKFGDAFVELIATLD